MTGYRLGGPGGPTFQVTQEKGQFVATGTFGRKEIRVMAKTEFDANKAWRQALIKHIEAAPLLPVDE
jgi:hypothetical protein